MNTSGMLSPAQMLGVLSPSWEMQRVGAQLSWAAGSPQTELQTCFVNPLEAGGLHEWSLFFWAFVICRFHHLNLGEQALELLYISSSSYSCNSSLSAVSVISNLMLEGVGPSRRSHNIVRLITLHLKNVPFFLKNQNTFACARLPCVVASPQRVLQLLSLSKTSKNFLSILII